MSSRRKRHDLTQKFTMADRHRPFQSTPSQVFDLYLRAKKKVGIRVCVGESVRGFSVEVVALVLLCSAKNNALKIKHFSRLIEQ